METYRCTECPLRAKYDQAPKSLVGRFWRWHINFCPGWKKYLNSLTDDEQATLTQRYSLSR